MKNITFQAGQRLAFIIVFGVGGGGGAPRGEGGVPTCRLSPIDLGLPAAAWLWLSEVSRKHSRQSLPRRPAGTTHDIMLTKLFVSQDAFVENYSEGKAGVGGGGGGVAWDSSFQPISLSRVRD